MTNNSITPVSVNQLPQAKQHQYSSLVGIYGPQQALAIVDGLTDRGRNSFNIFISKMNVFLKDLDKEKEDYYNELYQVFELNKPITTNEIIEKVVATRRKLEMDFYRSKLKVKCEGDFFALFAVREETLDIEVDGMETRTTVYVPFAKAKPDQLES